MHIISRRNTYYHRLILYVGLFSFDPHQATIRFPPAESPPCILYNEKADLSIAKIYIYRTYIGWCFLLIVAAASHIYHGRDDKSSIPPIDSRERDCVYLYTHSTRHVELHTAVMRAIYIPYAFVLCRDM